MRAIGISRPIRERLLEKTRVGGVDDCWEWTAYKTPDGYGMIGRDGKVVGAHRAIYELLVGPISDGLTIDHLCLNTSCMNPSHMEPVTREENTRRARARQTHCKNGHALVAGRRQRVCRTCANEASARWVRANPPDADALARRREKRRLHA